MKKIINLSLVFFALMLIGCEAESIVYEAPNGFVQFDAFPSEIGEPDDPQTLTVLLGQGTNPDGVTVNFSVTSEDPSRYEISPSNGVLEIPAGEFTADITITPIDNIIVDGNASVEIVLDESSDVPLGIGGEGVNAASTAFSIIDDDCPVDSQAFVGTFAVSEIFSPGGRNAGLSLSAAFGQSYQVELALDENDPSGTRFIITNSAGFDQYFVDGTTLRLFTCPGTATVDNPNIAAFANLTILDSSYDEGASSISMSGTLGNFGAYQIQLTRIE